MSSKGVLMDLSGEIVVKPCLQAEIDFYNETVAHHPDFAALIPKFYGSLQLGHTAEVDNALTANGDGHEPNQDAATATALAKEDSSPLATGKPLTTGIAVALENVVSGFVHPNIVDIKLGKRLWADDYDLETREKRDRVAAGTTSVTLGFRVTGIKVWTVDRYRLYDRVYGRSRTDESVADCLAEVLCAGSDPDALRQIIGKLLAALDKIEHIIASQESRMYSSSLLLVYEGDAAARRAAIAEDTDVGTQETYTAGKSFTSPSNHGNDDDDDDDESDEESEASKKSFDIRVIDFGHAKWTPGQGPDENMLCGIRSIRDVLRSIERQIDA